jgi:uncharacterized alpha-E superfamily protein
MTGRQAAGDGDMLDLLLELIDSTMTYRTRYKAVPQLSAVLDLVLADETNPRSVLFQLVVIEGHLHVLPTEMDETILSPAQRIVAGLRTDLQLANLHHLAGQRNRAGLRINLDRLMRRVSNGVSELSDLIAGGYFSHSAARQVSGPQRLEESP